ncbi:MAG: hypothetical protein GY916_03995 [Gammaproteobacteria bacterium]|nr:hypothetical protein [Gammaproteobacteria bacterium]
MNNKIARDEIMTAIRSGSASQVAQAGPELVPAGGSEKLCGNDRETLINDFQRYAAQEAATSERLAGVNDIPPAIARYLQQQELPLQVIAAGEIFPGGVDWSLAAELEIINRPIRPDGDTVVTGCYAGLAEAGAVVTVSSASFANELQFLAATHIVVVPVERILAGYDELWLVASKEFAAGMPRSMNWIVGPSRTADLGVPSKLGAHGPARVHLLVVER